MASVILFTCLSAATMSYHTSVDLISRSESAVRITSALREIRATVRDKLVSGRLEGKDEYESGITFSWKAVLSRESRNITQAADEITGGLEYGQFRMSLYEVTLIIACYQFGRERVSDYEYQELTWSAL